MLQPLFLVGNVYLHVLRPRGRVSISSAPWAGRGAQHNTRARYPTSGPNNGGTHHVVLI
jgi:hypothetical protein